MNGGDRGDDNDVAAWIETHQATRN